MKSTRWYLIFSSLMIFTVVGCGDDNDSNKNNDVVQRENDDDEGRTQILRSTDCYAEGPDTRSVAYKIKRGKKAGETNSQIFFYDCRTTNDCIRQFELTAARRVINGEINFAIPMQALTSMPAPMGNP